MAECNESTFIGWAFTRGKPVESMSRVCMSHSSIYSIEPGNDPSGAPLQQYGPLDGTSFTWPTNITSSQLLMHRKSARAELTVSLHRPAGQSDHQGQYRCYQPVRALQYQCRQYVCNYAGPSFVLMKFPGSSCIGASASASSGASSASTASSASGASSSAAATTAASGSSAAASSTAPASSASAYVLSCSQL